MPKIPVVPEKPAVKPPDICLDSTEDFLNQFGGNVIFFAVPESKELKAKYTSKTLVQIE